MNPIAKRNRRVKRKPSIKTALDPLVMVGNKLIKYSNINSITDNKRASEAIGGPAVTLIESNMVTIVHGVSANIAAQNIIKQLTMWKFKGLI